MFRIRNVNVGKDRGARLYNLKHRVAHLNQLYALEVD